MQAIADIVARRCIVRPERMRLPVRRCVVALAAAALWTIVAPRLEAITRLGAAFVLRERVAILVNTATGIALTATRVLALSLPAARSRPVAAALRTLVAGVPGACGRLIDADLRRCRATALAATRLILARAGLPRSRIRAAALLLVLVVRALGAGAERAVVADAVECA